MGYQNFYATRLFTEIGASDTTITLEAAPTEPSGRLVLAARNSTQREIISYTGISGNDITGVTRGQGGTTAKPHLKNTLVEMNLTAADIQDLYDAYNSFVASNGNGWVDLLDTPTTITNNGNRSYNMVFPGEDHTDLLSKGMRLRTTRTVAAPDQCADLEENSSHYFSNASPSGLTFTDDFTCMAWVKVESYGTGTVVSRMNGNTGFRMFLHADGTVELAGYSGSSYANNRKQTSYQSVPLNRWVHIAAKLNMSGGTGEVYIDGAKVVSVHSTAGTPPSSFPQAGALQIGSYNGTSQLFDGKIAQVGVFDALLADAVIQGYSSQSLSGSETNCVGAWSLDNDLTDLNSNGNDLAANNGAVATDTDSPFGDLGTSPTLDYGIVTEINFSTDTTITVQVPEGCTIPTSGGISEVSHSSQNVPYGFVREKDRWEILAIFDDLQGVTPSIAYAEVNDTIYVPVGSWSLEYSVTTRLDHDAGASRNIHFTLSSDAPNVTNPMLSTAFAYDSSGGSDNLQRFRHYARENVTLSSSTVFRGMVRVSASATDVGIMAVDGATESNIYRAECAYL